MKTLNKKELVLNQSDNQHLVTSNIKVTIGSLVILSLLTLAGCSLVPAYEKPDIETPIAFKEAPNKVITGEESSKWKTAQPAEDFPRGEWWKVFEDENLNALEIQAIQVNQDLKAAAARLAKARAVQKSVKSEQYPQIGAGFGATRQRVSPDSLALPSGSQASPNTLYRAGVGLSYEVDLFGRVSASVQAASADAQRSEALFRSVLLALQADVAQHYFQLREFDKSLAIYKNAVELRKQSFKFVKRRYDEGDVSEVDLARAKTELAVAQSEAIGIERNRAITEHALAILLGKTPAQFTYKPSPLTRVTLNIPAGLPSTLLERRPDIAAAERAMAAANSRIGVAKSAFFPSLNLTGGLGYESNELSNLFNWSSRTFLLGPLVGTALNLPIFDGDRRKSEVNRAEANYDEQVATYRQTVLNAFKEVEDQLSTLRLLSYQSKAQDEAVRSAERAAEITQYQYHEGSISYFYVIDADRSVLQQQRISSQLDGEKARNTVNLIRALGGGWDE
jgi:multidrug efflux system outer membrane protein